MKILILTKSAYVTSPPLVDYLAAFGHEVNITTTLQEGDLEHYDLGIALFFPAILKQSQLDEPKIGVLNIHQSLLPYGRGAYPNAFAILDQHKSGVTIHWMSEKVDEGNILHQKEVDVYPTDTAETLYKRLVGATFRTFYEFWPIFQNSLDSVGVPTGKAQPSGFSTNTRRDYQELMNLDKYDKGRMILDVMRAGTFPGYGGAYFTVDGIRYNVSVSIREGK